MHWNWANFFGNRSDLTVETSENVEKYISGSKLNIDNFILKNENDRKKITITPNYLIHNHLIGHRAISDKKNLLFNLRKFYFTNKINPF